MSNITPKDPMLYLSGDSLYEDATFRNEVELIEIIFGVLEDGKPPGYCPPEKANPGVYRVYSNVKGKQPAIPVTVNSKCEVIDRADFDGLNLPSIFTVNGTPTGCPPNYVFTFNNINNDAYNTGWDAFEFTCESGISVDPKLSVKRPA